MIRRTASPTRASWTAAIIAVVAVVIAGPAGAQSRTGTTGTTSSPSKAACIAEFEQAQELRAARKLVDARLRLLGCGSLRCPTDVQKECLHELALVEQSLPSIVLGLRDEAGHDIVDARALVDGTVRPLDGQALSLDPGRHTVGFQLDGCEPSEQVVLLGEGEKNRAIVGTVRCSGDAAAREPGSARAAAPLDPSAPPSRSPSPHPSSLPPSPSPTASPSRVLPLVLAGVGVVGVVGFVYLGAKGRGEIDDIRATGCAPSCDRDAVLDARTKLLAGDLLGAVGLVSLVAAAYFYITASAPNSRGARAVTFDARPNAHGGTMVVGGGF